MKMMINLSTKMLMVALIVSTYSATLAARQGSKIMDHLDTDGDNLISAEEFQPRNDRGARMLERADLDGDGAITLEEMQQARAARIAQKQEEMGARMAERAEKMEQNFTVMDTDNSGSVTPEEMRLHAFNRMDKNQDGYLTEEEFRQAGRDMREHGQHGHGGRQ